MESSEATQSIAPDCADSTVKSNQAKRTLSRRRFLSGAALACATVVGGDLWYERTAIETTYHRLTVNGLTRSCRLIQLTDLHRSWCVPETFITYVVDRTNQLRPDVVLLTGDFVTNSSQYVVSCANQIRRLNAPLGLYGVLGNHDYRSDHWKGGPAIIEGLAAARVEILTNRNVRLDNGLRLVGVDDFRTGRPDPDAAFRGISNREPMLAMTHNPFMFGAMCAYDCVTLAGHTHGGQVNIPFVTAQTLKWRMRYQRGWYQEPTGPGRMYVSRGLGVVGVPFRFGSLPEISVFDLAPA